MTTEEMEDRIEVDAKIISTLVEEIEELKLKNINLRNELKDVSDEI